ncbi:N-acetylmannosamine-6-phosphate 2-epimerase, partial [Escherichia coli]|nr:N-acetylmannosamine-6-phosphate 2-epimerase [Escherichia coli]
MLLSKERLEALRGKLVVSAQAYPGEPMRHPQTMAQMAASAVIGGAAAIRVQGLADIQFTRSAVEVPVIGLFK